MPAYSSGNNASLDKLKLWMTKDQLQQHAEFKSLGTSSEATGSGRLISEQRNPIRRDLALSEALRRARGCNEGERSGLPGPFFYVANFC